MTEYSLYIFSLYIATFFAALFTRLGYLKVGNRVALIIAAIAFIVAAFRPSYFPDVDTYELMFNSAASGDFSNAAYWLAHGEPGFKILSYLISASGLGYPGFLLVMACLSYILLFCISRISGVPFAYLWFCYFSLFFITRDLGVIRLSIASHLIVIFFIHNALIWRAVAIIIASLSFQYMALIVLLAKIMSRVKIDWFSVSLLFLLSFIVSNYFNFENLQFLIPEKQSIAYEGTNQFEPIGQSIIFPLTRNLLFAFIVYFFLKNQFKDKHIRVWVWAMLLSASFYVVASDMLLLAQRLSAYFGAILPLALAFIMHRRPSSGNVNFFVIVSISVLNFVSVFYFNDFVWR